MSIDRELGDFNRLLPNHPFNGSAGLTFVEHDGPCMVDTPAIAHVRAGADAGRLPAWVESCLPDTFAVLQAHHVGRREISTPP